MAKGGDVFVLDMGDPVKIYDLAKRMIELSGLCVKDETNPEGDIAIEITGLRPGEKLFEELLIGNSPRPTSHPRIMKAHEELLAWPMLQNKLHLLEQLLEQHDIDGAKELFMELVSGYTPQDLTADGMASVRYSV